LQQESAGAFMMDVVTIGETMALVRTNSSEKPRNNMPCTLAIGGTESNVAIGLSRLGHKVRWVSALGVDPFGNLVAETVAGEGVEVVARRDKDRQTGLMVKTPSAGTERFVSYYRAGSAASNLSPDDVPDSLISDIKIVHLTGVMPALSESTTRLALDVLDRSKILKKTVSFDVNFRPALWSEARASLIVREMAAKADVVFGDRQELQLLVDEPQASDQDILQQVANLGPSQVMMKLADEGAAALIDGEYFEQTAIKVDVIDTVGAGDAFVAGYLSALLDQETEKKRLFRAAFCGAMACTNSGDWEGAASRADLKSARRELV